MYHIICSHHLLHPLLWDLQISRPCSYKAISSCFYAAVETMGPPLPWPNCLLWGWSAEQFNTALLPLIITEWTRPKKHLERCCHSVIQGALKWNKKSKGKPSKELFDKGRKTAAKSGKSSCKIIRTISGLQDQEDLQKWNEQSLNTV